MIKCLKAPVVNMWTRLARYTKQSKELSFTKLFQRQRKWPEQKNNNKKKHFHHLFSSWIIKVFFLHPMMLPKKGEAATAIPLKVDRFHCVSPCVVHTRSNTSDFPATVNRYVPLIITVEGKTGTAHRYQHIYTIFHKPLRQILRTIQRCGDKKWSIKLLRNRGECSKTAFVAYCVTWTATMLQCSEISKTVFACTKPNRMSQKYP